MGILHDASGNVVTQTTNPQPFKLCAVVQADQATATTTRVLYAYQHSRGFTRQLNQEVRMQQNPQFCGMIEGLEIGDYVDVTLTVDPANDTGREQREQQRSQASRNPAKSA